MLRAVIFDWDGVVIDSSAHHERSWEILAARRGLTLPPDHFKRGFGKKNAVIIPELGWAQDPDEVDKLGREKEEIYRDLVRRHGIDPLPGVRQLLAALQTEGIAAAVGSSTEMANLDALLDMMGLRQFFFAFVSADDVTLGKPDPAVFLLAARRLGAAPCECLVIEDALVGIEAARRAGMPVLAVATTNPLAALGAATCAVASLAEIGPADLRRIAKGAHNAPATCTKVQTVDI